jgi:hypothetical protein
MLKIAADCRVRKPLEQSEADRSGTALQQAFEPHPSRALE